MQPVPSSNIKIIPGRASPSYIINGESIVVVDVGFPSDAKAVLAFVQYELGRDVNDIELIVITHSHIDHINGVDYLCNKTGAELAAHSNAEKFLTGGKAIKAASGHRYLEFVRFMLKNNMPRPSITDVFSMPWAGIPGLKKGIRSSVVHWLKDNEDLPGHSEWKVIHTPGHTDDSICLYSPKEKALITGDTIINLQGQLVLNPILRLDTEAIVKSYNKLRQLEVDVVYPGFGQPVSEENVLDHVLVDVQDK